MAEADVATDAVVTLVSGLSFFYSAVAVTDLAEADADATMAADATTDAANSDKRDCALRNLFYIFST